MSNEFKLVPTDMLRSALGAVEYLALRGDDIGTSNVPIADALRDLLAAAPQTPALGGEPEVLMSVRSVLGGLNGLCYETIKPLAAPTVHGKTLELIDRAHLAPLQAEIERWKACYEEASDKQSVAYAEANKLADQVEGLKAELECSESDSRRQGLDIDQLKEELSKTENMLTIREDQATDMGELIDCQQAEIKRLNEESFEGLYNSVISELDQLQARCDELEREKRNMHRELHALVPEGYTNPDASDFGVALTKPAGSEKV